MSSLPPPPPPPPTSLYGARDGAQRPRSLFPRAHSGDNTGTGPLAGVSRPSALNIYRQYVTQPAAGAPPPPPPPPAVTAIPSHAFVPEGGVSTSRCSSHDIAPTHVPTSLSSTITTAPPPPPLRTAMSTARRAVLQKEDKRITGGDGNGVEEMGDEASTVVLHPAPVMAASHPAYPFASPSAAVPQVATYVADSTPPLSSPPLDATSAAGSSLITGGPATAAPPSSPPPHANDNAAQFAHDDKGDAAPLPYNTAGHVQPPQRPMLRSYPLVTPVVPAMADAPCLHQGQAHVRDDAATRRAKESSEDGGDSALERHGGDVARDAVHEQGRSHLQPAVSIINPTTGLGPSTVRPARGRELHSRHEGLLEAAIRRRSGERGGGGARVLASLAPPRSPRVGRDSLRRLSPFSVDAAREVDTSKVAEPPQQPTSAETGTSASCNTLVQLKEQHMTQANRGVTVPRSTVAEERRRQGEPFTETEATPHTAAATLTHPGPHAAPLDHLTSSAGEVASTAPALQPPSHGMPPLTWSQSPATALPPPPAAAHATIPHTSDYDTPRQPTQRLGMMAAMARKNQNAPITAIPSANGQDEHDTRRDHADAPEPSPATLIKPGRYAASPFLCDEEASRGEASPQPFPPPDSGLEGTATVVEEEGGAEREDSDAGLVLRATLLTPATDGSARVTPMRPAPRGPPPLPHTSITQSRVSPSPQVADRTETSLRYELAEDLFDAPSAKQGALPISTTPALHATAVNNLSHNMAPVPATAGQKTDHWPPVSPAVTTTTTTTATSISTFNPFIDDGGTGVTAQATVLKEATATASRDALRPSQTVPPPSLQPVYAPDERQKPRLDFVQSPHHLVHTEGNKTHPTPTVDLGRSATESASAATSGRDVMQGLAVSGGDASQIIKARMHSPCFALFVPNSCGFVVCFNDGRAAPHTGKVSRPPSATPAVVSTMTSTPTRLSTGPPPRSTPSCLDRHCSRLCFCSTVGALMASGSIVDRPWVRGREAGRRCANALRALAQSPFISVTDETPSVMTGVAITTATQAQALLALLTAPPHPSIPPALGHILSVLIDDAMTSEGEARTFAWNKESVRSLVSYLLDPEVGQSALPLPTLGADAMTPSPMAPRTHDVRNDTGDEEIHAAQSTALQTIQALVSQGAREDAVTVALRHRLYTHAILIAMMCNTKDFYLQTVKAIVEHELTPCSPLAHAYCLFNELPCPSFLPPHSTVSRCKTMAPSAPIGISTNATENITPTVTGVVERLHGSDDATIAAAAKQNATNYLRVSWAQHAATLISNFTRHSVPGLLQLADDLVQHRLVLQGHTCLLLVHMTSLRASAASITRRQVSNGQSTRPGHGTPSTVTTATGSSTLTHTPESSPVMAELRQRLGVLGGFYHPRESCRANFLSPTTTLLTDLLQQIRLARDARTRFGNAVADVDDNGVDAGHHGLPVRTARYAIGFHFMQAMWMKEAGMLTEASQALSELARVVPTPASLTKSGVSHNPPQSLNGLIYFFGTLRSTGAQPTVTEIQSEQTMLTGGPRGSALATQINSITTQPSASSAKDKQENIAPQPVATLPAMTLPQISALDSAKHGNIVSSSSNGTTKDTRTTPPTPVKQVASDQPSPQPPATGQETAEATTTSQRQQEGVKTDALASTKRGNDEKSKVKERPRRSRSIEAIVRFFRRGGKGDETGNQEGVAAQEEVKPMILDTAKPPAYDKVTGRWLFEQTEEEKAQTELIRRGPPRLPPGRHVPPKQNGGDEAATSSRAASNDERNESKVTLPKQVGTQGPFTSAVRRGPNGKVRAQYVDMFNSK